MDRAAEPRHGAQGGVDVVNGLEPTELAADGLNLAGVEAIGFHFLRLLKLARRLTSRTAILCLDGGHCSNRRGAQHPGTHDPRYPDFSAPGLLFE
jgi:hypothetical protein